jgi:hypothetical protein
MRSIRFIAACGLSGIVLIVSAVGLALASPASNVTPTLLARGTYDSFKVMSYPDNGGLFKVEAKAPIDLVIRQHSYAVGGSTGWHAHPYPVLITVKEGTLTFYEYDDPTCTPIVVGPGQGYVDSGHGHIARNEGTVPALDISVIMAPVGAVFRTELDAPGPYCSF